MPACCAYGCYNSRRKGFKMYRLPSEKLNLNRRNIWLSRIRRKNFQPSAHTVLCEAHFEADQFERRIPGKLKPNALPTLFSYYAPPKRRKISKRKDLAKPVQNVGTVDNSANSNSDSLYSKPKIDSFKDSEGINASTIVLMLPVKLKKTLQKNFKIVEPELKRAEEVKKRETLHEDVTVEVDPFAESAEDNRENDENEKKIGEAEEKSVENDREKEQFKHLIKLSRDLGHFYKRKIDTDCVLRVGGKKFPVHTQILSARSEVFRNMFRYNPLKDESNIIDIDIDQAVFGDIIHYIYTGQLQELDPDTAAQMYVEASTFALNELKHSCLDVLKTSLTFQNVCNLAVLANTYGEQELQKEIVHFINENYVELIKTNEWKDFINARPRLAIELYTASVFVSKGKIKKTSS